MLPRWLRQGGRDQMNTFVRGLVVGLLLVLLSPGCHSGARFPSCKPIRVGYAVGMQSSVFSHGRTPFRSSAWGRPLPCYLGFGVVGGGQGRLWHTTEYRTARSQLRALRRA